MLGTLVELHEGSGGLVITLFILGFLIWLWVLVTVLKSTEMKDTDRIVWTVVLCTLNILGVILYWLFAPTPKARTEKELKDYFNNGGEAK